MAIKIIFIVASVLLFHTFAGYGLSIGLLALLRRRKVQKSKWTASVSLVLVARNAEDRIGARIENLLKQAGIEGPYEILVASDGSTDGTVEAVKAIKDDRVRLIEFKENRGKAAVLSEVVPQCKGEAVVFADVRQEFAENAVAELCANLSDPDVGAVSGELVLKSDEGAQGIGSGLSAYWSLEKMIRKAESGWSSVIGCTGSIYAIRKELFVPLAPETVLDDVAVPMLIALRGKRVVFDAEAKAWDEVVEDPSQEARRKVRTLAGNIQLCSLYPELICPFRNRLFVQFLSHKLLRLFAPWLLIVFFGATVMGASSSEALKLLVAAQGIFYIVAVLGIVLRRLPLGILKLPASFLLLNMWAARAPFHYWSGKLSPKWR